jgi:hypothetical protein
MGRSFFRPAATNTIEDYTRQNRYYHALSDTHFTMIRRDGEYFQRRWQTGLAGKEINAEEMKIDYVLGSGNHARSYLHRTPAGALIELPLGWYPDPKSPTGKWAMSNRRNRRLQARGPSREHCESWPSKRQTSDGDLYAMPSGDHQRASAGRRATI